MSTEQRRAEALANFHKKAARAYAAHGDTENAKAAERHAAETEQRASDMRARLIIDERIMTTVAEFLDLNDGLTDSEIATLRALEPGERVTMGGGAFATFTVRRVDEGG